MSGECQVSPPCFPLQISVGSNTLAFLPRLLLTSVVQEPHRTDPRTGWSPSGLSSLFRSLYKLMTREEAEKLPFSIIALVFPQCVLTKISDFLEMFWAKPKALPGSKTQACLKVHIWNNPINPRCDVCLQGVVQQIVDGLRGLLFEAPWWSTTMPCCMAFDKTLSLSEFPYFAKWR